MLYVDGAQKSGSGTIVRYAMGMAALLREELKLINIRAKRDNPGLRPQHLKAIEAVAQLSGGKIEGAEVGSREIIFSPGKIIKGGEFFWDIGTAGSTTMLTMTLLPVACFAQKRVKFKVIGGLFQDFAPSAFHMQQALFPLLSRMGVKAELNIIRPGYVPTGGGIIKVTVEPVKGCLKPINLIEQGEVNSIWGIALSSHLKERKVSHRMAQESVKILSSKGYQGVKIQEIYDNNSLQPGAALALFALTSKDCILGADRAGAPGRSSEQIGRQVAKNLLADLATGATVDRYLADQLIFYAALAEGTSQYFIPRFTEHVETNLWLVESILGAKVKIENCQLIIEGVGYKGEG